MMTTFNILKWIHTVVITGDEGGRSNNEDGEIADVSGGDDVNSDRDGGDENVEWLDREALYGNVDDYFNQTIGTASHQPLCRGLP